LCCPLYQFPQTELFSRWYSSVRSLHLPRAHPTVEVMYPIIVTHLAEIEKVMLADQLPSCIPQQLSKHEHTQQEELPHHPTHVRSHPQVHIIQWKEVRMFVRSVVAAKSAVTHTHTLTHTHTHTHLLVIATSSS